jgi:tetratricopeptide (TPR) repeat protein
MAKAPVPINVLDNYRAAVTANPASAEAQCNLGWGHYGQKAYAEAVKAFQAALALDANWLDAYYGLALAHKGAGATVDAVAAFEKVRTLAAQVPDVVRAHMLGRLAHGHINEIQKGDWDLDKELRHRVS